MEGEFLLAEQTLNVGKTHSERLMPLVDGVLRASGIQREQLQVIAVAAGPGSFTGIRIGVATARALAQGLSIPAVGVSTLEAMAEAVHLPGALVCPLLDARRNQVYTALYQRSGGGAAGLELLVPPAAVELEPFVGRLRQHRRQIVFTGEGLETYGRYLEETMGEQAVILPPPLRICRAALVAYCGGRMLQDRPGLSYRELLPVYLRRPEAERRLEEKERSSKCR